MIHQIRNIKSENTLWKAICTLICPITHINRDIFWASRPKRRRRC